MSLVEISIHKWKCDACGKIEYSKRLPKDWIVLDRNFIRKEIEHNCDSCKPMTKEN